MKNSFKILLISLIIIAVVVILAGPARLAIARKAADRFAMEKGLRIEFVCSEKIGSKEELLTQIWKLALWEEETRTKINDAFGFTDRQYSSWKSETRSGYEEEKELIAFARKEKWHALQKDLDREVWNASAMIFETAGSDYGLNEEAVGICYKKDRFGKITEVMRSVEDGAGMEAYDLACYGLRDDWSALPMDIAYGLRPRLIKAGCEASLLSAVRSNELYGVTSAVENAEQFRKRYQVDIDGLEEARKKKERLEYASKPEIPAVGMTTLQACSTKLGAPSRTTKETGSWSHKKHTYGDMVWERGGSQIFRLHYCDGEVSEVYDTRNSTATSPWVGSSGSSGGSTKPAFDPDDHDIEAYYEDNRDEYDDYDDAYEGFLDDEGVWDDY